MGKLILGLCGQVDSGAVGMLILGLCGLVTDSGAVWASY